MGRRIRSTVAKEEFATAMVTRTVFLVGLDVVKGESYLFGRQDKSRRDGDGKPLSLVGVAIEVGAV